MDLFKNKQLTTRRMKRRTEVCEKIVIIHIFNKELESRKKYLPIQITKRQAAQEKQANNLNIIDKENVEMTNKLQKSAQHHLLSVTCK